MWLLHTMAGEGYLWYERTEGKGVDELILVASRSRIEGVGSHDDDAFLERRQVGVARLVTATNDDKRDDEERAQEDDHDAARYSHNAQRLFMRDLGGSWRAWRVGCNPHGIFISKLAIVDKHHRRFTFITF